MNNLKYQIPLPKSTSKNVWIALVILIVGLILTIGATYYTYLGKEKQANQEFLLECSKIEERIHIRLHAHAQLLRNGAAYFNSSDTITRHEWKEFIENSHVEENLPGVQGVGFSYIVPKAKLQQHIQHIRNENKQDTIIGKYNIKPIGEREIYTSIIYLEPFNFRNRRAFGYDMFSEPVRRKAMEQSRDYDIASLTGKVPLVQDTGEDLQAGVLMYVPVYKKNEPTKTVEERRTAILGWVYSPYRMADLMKGILGHWDTINDQRIHLKVYDNDSLINNSLLFSSQTEVNSEQAKQKYRKVIQSIVFNGKKWTLYFSEPNSLITQFFNITLIVLFGGVLISFMLYALFLYYFNTQLWAHQISEQLTADLKESEEKYMTVADYTYDWEYWIDTNGNIVYISPSCKRITDYKPDDFLNNNKLLEEIIHPDDVNIFQKHNHDIDENGERSLTEFRIITKQKKIRWIGHVCQNIITTNGKLLGIRGSNRDITAQKKAEEELKKARREAEKANMVKSEFLSRMSHELRTPMNSIMGFAQLMEMSELNPSHRKRVNHILNNGKHLLKLINEMLDISGIEAGKLNLIYEPLQLTGIINEVIDAIQVIANKKNVTLKLIDSPSNNLFIQADMHRVKQVLLNLITNAIKYNKESGFVKISTELISTEIAGSSKLRISIHDSGIGIKAENISKLFQPFERIGADKSEIEGTGLGLAIVMKLTKAMGGTVGVESDLGVGSTFWIELPQNTNPPSVIRNKEVADKQNALPEDTVFSTVLYIEDNTLNIALVKEILDEYKPSVQLETSMYGKQALSLAKRHKPDLILLDLDLPDIKGSEVLEKLLADPNTKSIPVIIVSADAMSYQIENLKKAGATDYLTKPIDVIQFLKIINQYCKI